MTMSATETSSYDVIPYPSYSHEHTHPALLAAIAEMFSLKAPDIKKARVLEIGCADGANILPLAYNYPNLEIVGIDYSKNQIERAQAHVKTLALEKQAHFIHGSIADLDDSHGQFDYILCHGVYSWVDSQVQDAILQKCQDLLKPEGLVYISYNTYPGWKSLEIARDAMLFHTRHRADGPEKIEQALAMVKYIGQHTLKNTLYSKNVAHLLNVLEGKNKSYIAHEYLEKYNQPCYFYEFSERAKKHQLVYLADAEFCANFGSHLGADIFETLSKVSGNDQVTFEQYLDFITNRTFRRSILIKADNAKNIQRTLPLENFTKVSFYIAKPFKKSVSKEDPDLFTFSQANHLYVLNTKDEAYIAILDYLNQHRFEFFDYESLTKQLRSQKIADFSEAKVLNLIRMIIVNGLATIWSSAATFKKSVARVPAYPCIDQKLINYLEETGTVTSPFHQNLFYNSQVFKQVLPLFDGKHNQQSLIKECVDLVEKGKLNMTYKDDTKVTDKDTIQEECKKLVEHICQLLFSANLLINRPRTKTRRKKS